jgi:5'-3' exonuclease
VKQRESERDTFYFMDMDALSQSILVEMGQGSKDRTRIYDYIFMCFLLGNDFLPHFPALNIRTHGIGVLLDLYRNLNMRFIGERLEIQWPNVVRWFCTLTKMEHELLTREYDVRAKYRSVSLEKDVLENIPLLYRAEEMYIMPEEAGWESRYYKALFAGNKNRTEIKDIVCNYIEGLAWVFQYYTDDCPDWRWKYHYAYPPLLQDIAEHFQEPRFTYRGSFQPTTQLMYVLPKQLHCLLPEGAQTRIQEYAEYYPEKPEFKWAFCRYFWESHVILPEVPVSILQTWDECISV